MQIELIPARTNGNNTVGLEQVQISYQIFEGMAQPQPGPGPLAEVVRAVLDLDPEVLEKELGRLEGLLHTQLSSDHAGTGDSDTTGHDDEEAER